MPQCIIIDIGNLSHLKIYFCIMTPPPKKNCPCKKDFVLKKIKYSIFHLRYDAQILAC